MMSQRDNSIEKGLNFVGKLLIMLFINIVLVVSIVLSGLYLIFGGFGQSEYFFMEFLLGVSIVLIYLVNTERGNKVIFKLFR